MLLPSQPVTFDWIVSLAMTSREPCRSIAANLRPGDALRLVREPDNPHDSRAVAVQTPLGAIAGYLYAAEAGLLSLLLDRYPPVADLSLVEEIIAPGHSRHSPIVRLHIRLQLASAWPLFTIIAVIELKTESFPRRFDFTANPWLEPLLAMHADYLRRPDQFHLPWPIVKAWLHITRPADP
jgi:hypothetical protein